MHSFFATTFVLALPSPQSKGSSSSRDSSSSGSKGSSSGGKGSSSGGSGSSSDGSGSTFDGSQDQPTPVLTLSSSQGE
ncbi:37924_t:CDS:2, partial [Gigaspora margarita]